MRMALETIQMDGVLWELAFRWMGWQLKCSLGHSSICNISEWLACLSANGVLRKIQATLPLHIRSCISGYLESCTTINRTTKLSWHNIEKKRFKRTKRNRGRCFVSRLFKVNKISRAAQLWINFKIILVSIFSL